ncbi:MAG: FAD-binding oxidoreductase [Candidatus Eisenbacteria bacterium]|nr:FAD-binding oxidoreductase [Candidatus Eisenbacteria bacterium]
MTSPITPGLAGDLGRLLGEADVLFGEAASAYAVDGMRPTLAVRPGTVEELSAALRALHQAGAAVVVRGAGTFAEVGLPPRRYDAVLLTDRLAGITRYDPDDLTASVRAGTRFQDLQARLLPHRQWLALDPPGFGRATLGGVLATARAGPRRISCGAPRDKVLGMTAVLADGTVHHAGGRVVKNVAGYDLHRLYTGSYGTLAVIAEAHVRLSAVPAAHRTLIHRAQTADEAGALIEKLLGARLELGALALLDGECTRAADARGGSLPWRVSTDERAWTVAALVEGEPDMVEAHLETAAELAGAAKPTVLEGGYSETFWAAVSELGAPEGSSPAPDGRGRFRAMISVLPSDVTRLCARWKGGALGAGLSVHVHAHAGAGHIHVRAVGNSHDALAHAWDRVRADLEGHEAAAQLVDAPLPVKVRGPLWHGPAAPAELMRTFKTTFDPRGVLAPGRMPFDT